jgi:transcriptional regulator with PAS, ATPase and Fis domain
LANKGTIFLDEIGEMPLAMQAVLLRVLEDKEVIRLGGSNPTPVDVRVISATNKDLLEAIEAKEFRLDLYYRLNVIQLELPALRERKSDISFLANNFIKQFSVSSGKNITGITPEAISLLENYSWPGNIRELRNVIERAVNLSSSQVLTIDDLPKSITGYVVLLYKLTKLMNPPSNCLRNLNKKWMKEIKSSLL